MARLGVMVQEGSIGPSAIPTAAYSNCYAVFESPWGIKNQVQVCSSFGDFLRQYGGLNKLTTLGADGAAVTWGTETAAGVTDAYYSIKQYFDNKGTTSPGVLYAVRVASATGTAASRPFNDGAANNTVVTAKWTGDPGEAVEVKIYRDNAVEATATYYDIDLRHERAGIYEHFRIFRTSLDTDIADANRRSQLATITKPVGQQLPQTAATWAKLGVAPGTAATADDYLATAANYYGTDSGAVKTGLQCFNDLRWKTGMVIIPHMTTDTSVQTYIVSHCASYYRCGIFSAASGLTQTTMIDPALGVTATNTSSNDCAYYWPQIYVNDEGSQTGGKILVPNDGAIAGLFARMDGKYGGPHKSAAGIDHELRNVVDIERQLNSIQELTDDAGGDVLKDSPNFVNTIRFKQGRFVVWGLRTRGPNDVFRQVNVRRVVHLVYHSVFERLERYAFEPIDSKGALFARVRGDIGGFLNRLWSDGVLFGQEPGAEPSPEDAYQVICGRENNTTQTIGAGQLVIDVLIKPTLNAESVLLRLYTAQPGQVASPL